MNHFRTLGRLELKGADGRELRSILSQPRRLALLAFLAVASPRGFHRRDTLLALFWPESDTERARGSLRTALSALRRSLEAGVLVGRGQEEVGIDPEKLWCDAAAFEEALASGELEQALELYRGDLLEGFYIEEAPEYEGWLDAERTRLREKAAAAAWRLAEREEGEGSAVAAAQWARRGVALARDDEQAVRRLIALLDQVGDRAGALRAYEELVQRLREEYEVEPCPETRALIQAVRARDGAVPVPAASTEFLSETVSVPPSGPNEASPPARMPLPFPVTTIEAAAPAGTAPLEGRRDRAVRDYGARLAVTGAVLIIALAVASLIFAPAPGSDSPTQRVVVAPFENRTGEALLDPLGTMAADWISQGLMRTGLVQVVPITSVLSTVRATAMGNAGDSAGPERALARETGATILVSGAFYRHGDSIHFHTRITDARTGNLLSAMDPLAGSAAQPLQAVEVLRNRVTGSLAARLDWRLERVQSDGGSPPSWEAYHAAVQGIEAFINLRYADARTYFRQAADLDSTYAPALIFAAVNHSNVGEWAQADSLAKVLAFRRHTLAPPDQHILDWLTAYIHGDRPAALRSIREAIRMVPASEWLFVVGLAALHANHPAEVVTTFARPEAQRGWAGQWVPFWNVRTAAHHMLGEYEQELREARRARQHHPQSLSVLASEIRALAALGRLVEAERLLGESLLLPPEAGSGAAGVALAAARELRAHGHPVAAAAALERAIAWHHEQPVEQRQSPMARFVLGQVLYEAGHWQQARQLFSELAGEQPENIDQLGYLGVIAARTADHHEAERISRVLAELNRPYLRGAHTYWRARIAAAAGDRERAILHLRESFAQGRAFGENLHAEMDFEPLRDHPSFRELLRPKG